MPSDTLTSRKIATSRLTMHVLSGGSQPGDRPVLFVHGNVSSGVFFRDDLTRLPPGFCGLAPDLRGYGQTEPKAIAAARGVRDFSDDLHSLVVALGLDRGPGLVLLGWSVGGAVVMQYAIDHPQLVAGLVLEAPMSPYGFGGTHGVDGKPCFPDFAGSGGGAVNPDFIARLRQAGDPGDVAVGRNVVVIGGGMTAIDAAVQSKKLGAECVTIVYRRGQQQMPASRHEQQWAQHNGVLIRTWSVLQALHSANGRLAWATFADVAERDGRLAETGQTWTIEADMLLKAIGQTLDARVVPGIELQGGRIRTDADGRTSIAGVWAGGDCRHGGRDLTVEAVQHGKLAAESIHRALERAPR